MTRGNGYGSYHTSLQASMAAYDDAPPPVAVAYA